MKKATNKVYVALSRIKIELSFIVPLRLISPKIVLANKPERKKRRADKAIPARATMTQAEKKSSRILFLSFSAAKKRTLALYWLKLVFGEKPIWWTQR